MSDLEARLADLRREADATIFVDVAVTPELRERVVRAALASADAAERVQPVRRRAGTRVVRWRGAGVVAATAGVVLVAVLAVVQVWPGGTRAASAALTVKPADARYLVAIADPHSLAGSTDVVVLADGVSDRIPVEIDSASALTYRWSPDGRRLVFGNRGDLFVFDSTTGRTTNVTRTPRRWELLPSWSPDGTMIAFTSRPLDRGEGPPPEAPASLDWVMVGAFGGNPTVTRIDGRGYRVVSDETTTSAPTWSPDSTTLAFASDGVVEGDVPATASNRRDGTISLANVATGAVRVVATRLGRGARYVGAPTWSPTGSELAVFFSDSDRFPSRDEVLQGHAPAVRQGWALLDLDTGDISVIHSYEAPFVPRGPARWSDDGTLLALLLRQETAIAEPSELLVVRRGGGPPVLRLPGVFSHVDWEPGARRLAARDDLRPPSVVLLDVGDERARVEQLRFDGEIDGLAWRAGNGS